VIQAELNREVAAKTGETVSTIREMGFGPLMPMPYEREPLTVDWDEVDRDRDVVVPLPQARPAAVA
jgi:hypothetical protein